MYLIMLQAPIDGPCSDDTNSLPYIERVGRHRKPTWLRNKEYTMSKRPPIDLRIGSADDKMLTWLTKRKPTSRRIDAMRETYIVLRQHGMNREEAKQSMLADWEKWYVKHPEDHPNFAAPTAPTPVRPAWMDAPTVLSDDPGMYYRMQEWAPDAGQAYIDRQTDGY